MEPSPAGRPTVPRPPRRTYLALGTAALFAVCATLWMTSPAGPPRALVALFDSDWQADLPFEASDALEIRAPLSLGDQLVEIEHHLRAANLVGSLRIRDEGLERVFLLVAAQDVPRSRLEALVDVGVSSLTFLPVLDDGETAQAIRAFLGTTSRNPVTANSKEELITKLESLRDECAPCRPQAGETLVIENDGDRWLAMVVSHRPPIFDQTHIRGAKVGVSAQNRPTLYVYFTAAGRRAFLMLTREAQRLAVIFDGQVLSSAHIMQEIDTERIELSIGDRYSSHDALTQEANRIADALTAGIALPREATWSVRALPAASGAAKTLAFALTLLIAVLGGVLGAKVLALFERWAGIVPAPTTTVPANAWPNITLFATRGAATLLALAAPHLVMRIPIPVLDPDLLDDTGPSNFSALGVAGLTPLFLAHILVALIVWTLPTLKSLRGGDFTARRRLLLPTGLIAFALCTLQAVGMTPLYTVAGLLEPDVLSSILLSLSLTAGTFLLWGAGALATLVGFGSGFSLLVVGAVLHAVFTQPTMIADGRTQATVLALGVLLAYTTTRRLVTSPSPMPALTAPRGTRRLPLAGLTPIELLVLIQALLFLASLLFDDDFRTPQLGLWVSLAVFVGLTIALAWLVAKPIPTRAFARGLIPTTLLVLLVVQGAALVAELGPKIAPMNLAELLALVLMVPILLDVGQEVLGTARYGRLSRVASTHDPDEADRLAALLSARDIPTVIRGIRHRTLLRFLAPYVPVEVLVPLTERRASLAFLREDAMDELAEPFGSEPPAPEPTTLP